MSNGDDVRFCGDVGNVVENVIDVVKSIVDSVDDIVDGVDAFSFVGDNVISATLSVVAFDVLVTVSVIFNRGRSLASVGNNRSSEKREKECNFH